LKYGLVQFGYTGISKVRFVSFNWKIETINIQSCYWKMYSNSYHFVGFAVFNSFVVYIFLCLSTYPVKFIISCIFIVAFIFLFYV
jgi:hypothetical protein